MLEGLAVIADGPKVTSDCLALDHALNSDIEKQKTQHLVVDLILLLHQYVVVVLSSFVFGWCIPSYRGLIIKQSISQSQCTLRVFYVQYQMH
jgi:hypothetical protein